MELDEKLKQALKWIDCDDVVIIENIFEEFKQQSQDRERVLQEKLDTIQETHTDNEGYIWEAPTSYAYAMACKALHEHTKKERVLREALEEIQHNCQFFDMDIIKIIADKALEASK